MQSNTDTEIVGLSQLCYEIFLLHFFAMLRLLCSQNQDYD